MNMGTEMEVLNVRLEQLEQRVKIAERLLLAVLELCAAIGTDAALRPGVLGAQREKIRNDAANLYLLIDQCLRGDET